MSTTAASPPPAGGPTPGGLSRRLGPGLLTLYGIGVMVGAGIYVLIGEVAGDAGLLAPLTFALAAIIAAPTAISYAELAVRIPVSAGEAAYVHRATGSNAAASVVGMTIVGVGITSAAAVLQGGIGYLGGFVDLPRVLLLCLVAAAIVVLASLGVLESLAVAGLLTLVEIVGLVLVVYAGMTAEPSADWLAGPASEVPWSGLAVGTMLAFFAFIGFEDMVNLAEEVRDPARSLPVAIIAALIGTTVLYGLVAVAAIRSVNLVDLAATDEPLVLVAEGLTARAGSYLGVIAVFATLNGVLAQIIMASRVLFGLGRSMPFARSFHVVNRRFGTPVRATLVIGLAVIVAAITVDLDRLAEITSMLLLLVFAAVNVALIRIRRLEPSPGFTAPRWLPWFGIVTSLLGFAIAVIV